MKRCKSKMERLDSRCLLHAGHETHMYANFLLKKDRPELFDKLQGEEIPYFDLILQLEESEHVSGPKDGEGQCERCGESTSEILMRDALGDECDESGFDPGEVVGNACLSKNCPPSSVAKPCLDHVNMLQNPPQGEKEE